MATLDTDSLPLEPGTVFGSYRLVRRLGVGGFAEVWEAERDDGTGNVALLQSIATQAQHLVVVGEIVLRERAEGFGLQHLYECRAERKDQIALQVCLGGRRDALRLLRSVASHPRRRRDVEYVAGGAARGAPPGESLIPHP